MARHARLRIGIALFAIGAAVVVGAIALWPSAEDSNAHTPQTPMAEPDVVGNAPALLHTVGPDVGESADNEVHGRVVGPEGKPVHGLRVLVDGLGAPFATDAQARFVVRDLGVGTHTFLPVDASANDAGSSITLQVTSTKPRYEVVLRVPRTYPLAGKVVTPAGDPVPDLRIELWHASGDGLSTGADASDSEGTFEARVAEAGVYFAKFQGVRLEGTGEAGQRDAVFVYEADARNDFLVRVVDPDGKPVPSCTLSIVTGTRLGSGALNYPIIDGLFRAHPDQWGWGDTVSFHVRQPRDADGTLMPFPEGSASGVQVSDGEVTIQLQPGRTVSVHVQAEDGTPIPGARVVAKLAPAWHFQRPKFGETDDRGRVAFKNVTSSPIRVSATARGFLSAKQSSVVPSGQLEVTITLRRGSPFEVSVVNAAGDPVLFARVNLLWADDGKPEYKQVDTDAKGIAYFETVPPGAQISVTVNAHQLDPPLPSWRQQNVPYGDGTLAVQLRAAVALGGTLLGTEEQRATMTVQMQGTDSENFGWAETVKPDPKTGAFAFHTALPGPYRIWVPHTTRGQAPGRETRVTAPATDVRVQAPTSVVVEGRLFAKSPQRWKLNWFQEPVGAQAVPGSEGHFRIRGVRDERGSLLARSADLTRLAYLEDVDPRDGPFELRPVNAQTIAGRVEGAEHVVRARIALRRGALVVYASVYQGKFTATGVPPGRWTAELWIGVAIQDRVEGVDHMTTDLVLRASD